MAPGRALARVSEVQIKDGASRSLMLGRYLAKLGANSASFVVGAAHLAIVPRILGPEMYGHFVFLSNFFQQSTAFLDLGTSSGLYVKLSQRQNDHGLVWFYLGFAVCTTVLLLTTVFVMLQQPLAVTVWGAHPARYVMLAAVLGCLTWWHQIATKVIDSYGLTVRGELSGIATKIFMVGVLVLIAYQARLSLESYLLLQIATFAVSIAILAVLAIAYARRQGRQREKRWREYAREIWDYSHPLVTYTVVGAITWMLERWLLQTQAGALEQGYYGIAFQIGAICFLFTSALVQLLTREFAIAWHAGDHAALARMFSRYAPMFYALASVLSVFAASRAGDLIWLIGGTEYAHALWAVVLMSLYPMHQTYGQLSGSLYYASGYTRLYRDITTIGMVAGLALAYFLIVPRSMGGLDLGATGLAIKMFTVQVLVVNVMLWFNARMLDLSFGRILLNQVKVPLILALIAWGLLAAERWAGLPRLAGLVVSACAYFIVVCVIILFRPHAFDLHPQDVARVRRSLGRLKRGRQK